MFLLILSQSQYPMSRSVQFDLLLIFLIITIRIMYYCTRLFSEPSILLTIEKDVLTQIYHKQQSKLCEIRIRLLGANVDLLHAIAHPLGKTAFLEHLTRERNQRLLTFYKTVEKFDRMCKVVCKIYQEVGRLLDKNRSDYVQESAPRSTSSSNKSGGCSHTRAIQDTHVNSVARLHLESQNGSNIDTSVEETIANNVICPYEELPSVSIENESIVAHNSVGNGIVSSEIMDHLQNPAEVDPLATINPPQPNSPSTNIAADHTTTHPLPDAESPSPVPQMERLDIFKDYKVLAKPRTKSNAGRNSKIVPLEDTNYGDAGDSHTLDIARSSLLPVNTFSTNTQDLSTYLAENLPSTSKCETDPNLDSLLPLPYPLDTHQFTTPPKRSEEAAINDDEANGSDISPTGSPLSFPNMIYNTTPSPGASVHCDRKNDLTDNENEPILQRTRRLTNKIQKNILELKELARHIMEAYIFDGAPNSLRFPTPLRIRTERAFSTWCDNIRNIRGSGDIVTSVSSPEGRFRVLPLSSFEAAASNIENLSTSTSKTAFSSSRTQTFNNIPVPAEDSKCLGSRELSFKVRRVNSYITPENLSFKHSHTPTVTTPLKVENIELLDPAYVIFDTIDMNFVDLFRESKLYILTLLRAQYPGWKGTVSFDRFLATIKPYFKQGGVCSDNS